MYASGDQKCLLSATCLTVLMLLMHLFIYLAVTFSHLQLTQLITQSRPESPHIQRFHDTQWDTMQFNWLWDPNLFISTLDPSDGNQNCRTASEETPRNNHPSSPSHSCRITTLTHLHMQHDSPSDTSVP